MKREKKEKKFYKNPWFILSAVILVIALWFVFTYNYLIGLDQSVQNQWAQVESQYQRRYDLIPNLVNTARGYMQFERSLLEEVTTLRSQWAAAETVDEKITVANQWDSAISRLLLVVENYPELKAIEAINSLMDELAGTENRIAVERMRFNDRVRSYNTAIKVIPTNMVANWFGFTEKTYFEAVPGASEAPEVNI